MELNHPAGRALVERLRAALTPGIDPTVVDAAFAAASDRCGGPRRRDGRRASTLTPSGVPVEVSISGGGPRSPAALRYVADAGSGLPFFGPRLAAQRRALDTLATLMPGGAAGATGELRTLVELLFPAPGDVPARTRFATFLGVVHTPRQPRHLAALKVYGNLRATDPRAALARLGRRWPAFDTLARVALAPGFGSGVTPQFAAIEVDADGSLRHKLYVRTRASGPSDLAGAIRRVGGEPAVVDEVLAEAGLPGDRWARPVFGCLATGPGSGDESGEVDEVDVSVHVSARAVEAGRAEMAAAARALWARHGDLSAMSALLEAETVDAGAADADATHPEIADAEVTVVGVGLRSGGRMGKVNVYAAPVRGGRQTEAPTFSNSGWMGSRVGS